MRTGVIKIVRRENDANPKLGQLCPVHYYRKEPSIRLDLSTPQRFGTRHF